MRRAWPTAATASVAALLAACAAELSPNTSPEVAFVAPSDGAVLAADAPVELVAEVGDAETPTDALDLYWQRSDGTSVEGEQRTEGTRVTLRLPGGLLPGRYRFTLTAVDDRAASARATVDVDVRANQPPAITWESPADRTSWPSAPDVVLRGRVADPDTPDLTAVALEWSGSLDFSDAPSVPAVDGTFAFPLAAPPLGEHVVRVVATDALGGRDVVQVGFAITPGDGDGDASFSDVDCDDDDPAAYPGAPEVTGDGVDQDCDGRESCFADADEDGHRPLSGGATLPSDDVDCDDPGEAGGAIPADDCDDADASTYPGATEHIADSTDQDCDGGDVCFADDDDDGFRGPPAAILGSDDLDCDDPGEATAITPVGDCDDARPEAFPGATEVCDGRDEDCDGGVDEGVLLTFYTDEDGDAHGDPARPLLACAAPTGAVVTRDDCDDREADTHPGAVESVGDGVDRDCDGTELCFDDDDGDGFLDASADLRLSSDTDCLDVLEGTATTPTTDCADAVFAIHPGATEIIGDSVDQNCDAREVCLADVDADGYRPAYTVLANSEDLDCADPGEALPTTPDGDCDDRDAEIRPGATERTGDSIDQDCDGRETCFDDDDDDTFLDASGDERPSSDSDCYDLFEGQLADPTTDCDDADATRRPDAIEVIADEVDQNCDATEICFVDLDRDGFRPHGTATTTSADVDCDDTGEASLSAAMDCDDAQASVHPGAGEACNSVDDDCDGFIDDGVLSTFYRDADGDTYGAPATTKQACVRPAGFVANPGDCNDANAAVRPLVDEIVGDGVDQDCNGEEICFDDGDGDGVLDGSGTTRVSVGDLDCRDLGEGTNTDPAGDCDDTMASVFPGATEVIADGVDQDCDETEMCFADADADGFRPFLTVSPVRSDDLDCDDPAEGAASMPTTDCDDDAPDIYPGAPETTANGVDEDCDGRERCFDDDDHDGHLDATGDTRVSDDDDCVDAFEGAAGDPTDDCDDTRATVYPGATELIANGIDDDCDGTEICYTDGDSDGYRTLDAQPLPSTDLDCDDPGEGAGAEPASDCDDARATTHPGATETCNGRDDDCDAVADEGLKIAFYRDADGDSYGTPSLKRWSCEAPAGYVADTGDCNDALAAVRPGAAETCNARDDDCDGATDEDRVDLLRRVPSAYATIQAAIDAACDDDTIEVAAGTYTGTIDAGARALHLVGASGASVTTLNGGGAGPVVRLERGILEGFTITGGAATAGAGVQALPSAGDLVALRDLVVASNTATGYGGGVYAVGDGALAITDVRFLGNGATGGGGWYSNVADFDAVRVDVRDNVAEVGAGAWLVGGGTLENLVVAGNQGSTGLTLVRGSAPLALRQLSVVGNTDDGVHVTGSGTGALNLRNSAITDHTGVGVRDDTGALAVQYSLFYANGTDAVGLAGGWTSTNRFVAPSYLMFHLGTSPETWNLRPAGASPLRDGGDPTTFDADTTRADLGAFGGPEAWP